jgi:hypothetical protein
MLTLLHPVLETLAFGDIDSCPDHRCAAVVHDLGSG